MTRWKPNLAPVDEALDAKMSEELRLKKVEKLVESPAARNPIGDVSIAELGGDSKASDNTGQSAPENSSSKTSNQANPLDDASIDDLGSFLELSSEEKTKESETPDTKAQNAPQRLWDGARPYFRHAAFVFGLIAILVGTYLTYRFYYTDTKVTSTVYVLNNNQPVHHEALKITDPATMSNFVQRFFVTMLLERGMSSSKETRFASAVEMLDWFRKSLKIDREVGDHAARITFNLTGSDPVFMSRLIDGYVSSYIESRVAMDAQTPVVETNVLQSPAPSKSSNNASPESEATVSNNLKVVDEKLKKLDEIDQEYVSALRLLSKDRLIGITDSNVFRGFMPESDLATNSALAKLQSRVVELAVQKNALQVKFAPSSREIQSIEQEIRGIREAMRQYLNEQRQFVQARRGEMLAERAEVLRQKAILSVETESSGASQPQQQSYPVAAASRRPVQGNLPSGRFWYVGQDGTTIIAEPTSLGKSMGTTAVNNMLGQIRNDAPQAFGYSPTDHLNGAGMQGQYNQLPYNQQQVYGLQPNYPPAAAQQNLFQNGSQINNYPSGHHPYGVQPNQFQQAPQVNVNQTQGPVAAQGISMPKTNEYDQQARSRDSYPSQTQGREIPIGSSYAAPPMQYQPASPYASPLHTGVGQSPLMSHGLGSKFHQPNPSLSRSQTPAFRGSY